MGSHQVGINTKYSGPGGVAQWLECQPIHQKVAGLTPGRGTYLGGRFDP